MPSAPDAPSALADRFRTYIRDPRFACVGAKSALSRGQMTIRVARSIASSWNDLNIYPDLIDFVNAYRAEPTLFRSFVVLFEGPTDLDERSFERHLWDRVQSLSDKDVWFGECHDPRVSSDPANPHFSLSFGGEAFFVVGLHPGASRQSRRFEVPVMVFNLHDQFERLRVEGLYERLRGTILTRDRSVSGSDNPMLARHGDVSEARQYSGRAVADGWKAPYQRGTSPQNRRLS